MVSGGSQVKRWIANDCDARRQHVGAIRYECSIRRAKAAVTARAAGSHCSSLESVTNHFMLSLARGKTESQRAHDVVP